MHKHRGFTLVEMLISMTIFAVVAFLTMVVITSALRYNAQQQATVAAQSKLRRVVEVIGQEVRSSVFGGVAHAPYNSNHNQLSIYLLDQGAGYTVVNEGSFNSLSSFSIMTENQPTFSQALLVDSFGNPDVIPPVPPSARLFPVSNVTPTGTDTWRISHAGCTNGIDHNRFLQAFGVKSLGFRLDAATRRLMLSEGGTEVPMAFGITDFKVQYVYAKQSGGAPEKRTTPFLAADGLPAKIHTTTTPPETYLLSELQITISTEEQGKTTVTRTYTGQVPLLISSNDDFVSTGNNVAATPANQNKFNFTGVSLCN